MSIYPFIQICGDTIDIKFRRNEGYLFCTVDGGVTLEDKHIRILAAALDAYEAGEAAEVAA